MVSSCLNKTFRNIGNIDKRNEIQVIIFTTFDE